MKKKFENTYGKTLKSILFAVNPLKKKVIKTYCTIHRFINLQAIEILKNEGNLEQYALYKSYVKKINEGVTWADQDFKSSNHFYHFSRGKGLYGFSDALSECKKYYNKALAYLDVDDVGKAMFYFGAACHLIQDATVPQHVNNKLLKSHRQFELWIISKFMSDYSFIVEKGILRYSSLEEYIKNNALVANNTYLKYSNIKNRNERYEKIATTILREAQKTTAGMMMDFYSVLKSYDNFDKIKNNSSK